MNNKQETLNRIEQLEAVLEKMKKSLVEPEKWEPQGGKFTVSAGGVAEFHLGTSYRGAGLEYLTKALAEKAARAMRTHNRLVAYVLEHAPDYEPDWHDGDENKFYVIYSNFSKDWGYSCSSSGRTAGCVYMPKYIALKLVEDLNSGRVVL